ncbi:hypothetical protein J4573_45440 [Actinomadura barringtoniae]|uniref:Ankyrin n=1 Tax=Actinomadura barringtoniae TaxID=1427535 RepID=A0A939PSQ4_9ACTN|nr:hypothetical protein [Actinomadura barringtoniae]MBO2454399.1 hypothetical protein [Actinomadura barringtoniae]
MDKLGNFAGDFEVHLTVAPGDVGALERWAHPHGLKLTHIVLERGRTVSQPMLTLRATGGLPEVRAAAERAAGQVRSAGFAVRRLKIEAAPWNEGVPVTDEDAVAQPVDRYFEHHVKLVLSVGGLDDLAALAVPHNAHVSRNARRVRPDGRQERFVTQRCTRVGDRTAAVRLDALTSALRAARYEIASVEREYVVVDTDASLDDGWIDPIDERRNGR